LRNKIQHPAGTTLLGFEVAGIDKHYKACNN
jgi:hypothetical protein